MRIGYDSHYSYITTYTGYHDALLTLYWLSQNSTGTQKQVTSSIPALLLSIIPYPSKSNMMIPLDTNMKSTLKIVSSSFVDWPLFRVLHNNSDCTKNINPVLYLISASTCW